MTSIAVRAFAYALFLSLFFPDIVRAQIKDIVQPVGIIQYNVKNHQGGWISGAPPSIIKLQVQLIAHQIRSRATQNPPVDFIALEQSQLKGNNGEDGDISSLLAGEGISGWTMIQNLCLFDVTQLAYSPDWELVTGPNLQNPLVNGLKPQIGWVPRGCQSRDQGGVEDGRPYNIAYFNNKKTSVRVLFIITHMPHCSGAFEACIQQWNVAQLKNDIRRVVGKEDLRQIHLVMAGDMNEFGASDKGSTFDGIFSEFGPLQISTNLVTCCYNDGYNNAFDRLLANSPTRPAAEILTYITDTNQITYPLNPNFSGKNQPQKAKSRARKAVNEEHKAIFGVVEFAPRAK